MYFSDEKSITDENDEASFKAHSHGAVRAWHITLFLLLYKNHRDDLQISDYVRSCLQVNISCEWVFSGSCD